MAQVFEKRKNVSHHGQMSLLMLIEVKILKMGKGLKYNII